MSTNTQTRWGSMRRASPSWHRSTQRRWRRIRCRSVRWFWSLCAPCAADLPTFLSMSPHITSLFFNLYFQMPCFLPWRTSPWHPGTSMSGCRLSTEQSKSVFDISYILRVQTNAEICWCACSYTLKCALNLSGAPVQSIAIQNPIASHKFYLYEAHNAQLLLIFSEMCKFNYMFITETYIILRCDSNFLSSLFTYFRGQVY